MLSSSSVKNPCAFYRGLYKSYTFWISFKTTLVVVRDARIQVLTNLRDLNWAVMGDAQLSIYWFFRLWFSVCVSCYPEVQQHIKHSVLHLNFLRELCFEYVGSYLLPSALQMGLWASQNECPKPSGSIWPRPPCCHSVETMTVPCCALKACFWGLVS